MKALTRTLIAWYAQNKAPYPWRKSNDPYTVWLSEILLQQTRIPVVMAFYEKILNRYPDLHSLAEAKDFDFLALWSGMGYYRRAQNMLECARTIRQDHGGTFPSDFAALIALPGIGKYTAGALRNICFGKLTPALDGNIRRVLSRLCVSHLGLEQEFLNLGKGTVAGDFFQSLMELGEKICLPNPLCDRCPVQTFCEAFKQGTQKEFPVRRRRKEVEVFHWYLLVLNSGGSHYYAQNKSRPFLKNAWIFPDLLATGMISPVEQMREFRKRWGIAISGVREANVIQHAVTFRKIFAHILVPRSFEVNGSGGKWLLQGDFDEHPTSSITAKVLRSLQIKNAQAESSQQPLKRR